MVYYLLHSNRWKHLLAGILIGAGANEWYCALYAGIGVATAVEVKDRLWGGRFDITDLLVTVVGAVFGHLIRKAII